MGKYSGQSSYQYYGKTCLACYKSTKEEYRWTNSLAANDTIVNNISLAKNCVTPKKIVVNYF